MTAPPPTSGTSAGPEGPSLRDLGWDHRFQVDFDRLRDEGVGSDGNGTPGGVQALVPGRVVVELRGVFRVRLAGQRGGEEVEARLAGRIHHQAVGGSDLPTVGDWVALSPPDRPDAPHRIEAILPRRSFFSRRAAGREAVEQGVAANVDTVFLVTGLDGDFNLRRIERYLAVAFESGATPVVLLTKADLHPDPDEAVSAVEDVALGVDVHALSVKGDEERRRASLEILRRYLAPGKTVAFLGSSGVGKSTLLNHLAGHDLQATGAVRESDSRGRHTTTHRELFRLPSGALAIDTPGMRELQVWDVEEGLQAAFGDIEEIAAGCRFRDCGHRGEPGCAVDAAIESGELASARFDSYRKLSAEAAVAAVQADAAAKAAKKRRDRVIHKAQRKHKPRG